MNMKYSIGTLPQSAIYLEKIYFYCIDKIGPFHINAPGE